MYSKLGRLTRFKGGSCEYQAPPAPPADLTHPGQKAGPGSKDLPLRSAETGRDVSFGWTLGSNAARI